jgi:xylulokinase
MAAPIVELERLPEIAWATEVAGSVTAQAARETGLAEGTPVLVGSVDAAAEAVSVGVTSPGQMMLMYGSTVFMIEVLDSPIMDARLWSVPFLFPGTTCLEAGMATSGALTRWVRDELAPDLVTIEAESGTNAYELLTTQASGVPPGSEGLIVLPYFSGERTPINDPRARGVFFGLTLAHTRAHLFRAVLEGIGYGIRQHFEVMEQIGARPHEVVAVGGGTRSSLWPQIVSDVTGVPQRVPAITTGAAYGDAFLAGLGVGLFSSCDEIATWLRDIRTITPDPAHTELYTHYYRLYLELYQRNKDLMHALAELA